MEFKQQKRHPHAHRYEKDVLDISFEFAKQALKELKELVKGIVLFGSMAKKLNAGHDIDILIVIDDLTVVLTDDLVEAYRIIVEKLIVETSPKIHVTTLKFSSFWEYARVSDPVVINILRDGVALYDTGFFYPLQNLLYRGRIRPTLESIWVYFQRAPKTILNAKWHIKQATIDLYWAIIDASHAALMKVGQIPPSPEHVTEMIKIHLIDKKLLEKKYGSYADKYYKIMKDIVYGKITNISGRQFDKYEREANEYVERIKKFVDKK